MSDEGYIKFKLVWDQTPAIKSPAVTKLLESRNQLHQWGLIGVTADGIGFGNISKRLGKTEHFIITGTQTGQVENLTAAGVTEVTDCSFINNSLRCRGPVKASSESLSHAALYVSSVEINAVIHVHSSTLWNYLLTTYPATHEAIPYGTPEMASEIKRVVSLDQIQQSKIFAMAGHHGGVIAFGNSLEQALEKVTTHSFNK